MYPTRTKSYSPLMSENWMCVEDPFSLIWSHIVSGVGTVVAPLAFQRPL